MAEENKDITQKVSSNIETASKKVQNKLRNSMNTIALVMLMIFAIALSLVNIGFTNGTSITFWVNLAVLVFMSCVAMFVMAPLGMDSERKNLAGYYENRRTWGTLTSKVHSGYETKFSNYCAEYTKQLREKKKESYIQQASISIEDYQRLFEDLTPRQLKDYYRECRRIEMEGEEPPKDIVMIGRLQYKLLLKTKRKIRIKPVISTYILNNSHNKYAYTVGQKKRVPELAKATSKRAILLVLTSILMVSIVIAPAEAGGLQLFVTIVIRLFTVVVSSLLGFNAGKVAVRNNNDDTLDRIAFLSGFMETIGTNTKEVLNSKEELAVNIKL